MKKTVMLIVLDGWGYREETKHNAIAAAQKPFFDRLWNTCPHTLLEASGAAVGLPDGQVGNSEVGHTTIGSGTPADTDLVRIDKSIKTSDFDTNSAFKNIFDHVVKNKSTLHVMGLVSTGGVHSHQNHLHEFLRLAKKNKIPRVAVHVFTDGRDTPPQSAAEYIKNLEQFLKELGQNFFIATISGRYFAMDRDHNWDRLKKTEDAIFEGKGNVCTIDPSAYVAEQYKKGVNDEFLEPTVCTTPHGHVTIVQKNDAILVFNFRSDRVRMLSKKILELPESLNILLATFTEYHSDFKCAVAFPNTEIKATLGGELAKAGLNQAHIAETEKFAHATYFLNGGQEKPYINERDIMIPSRKDVKTHDEAPEMKAKEIADAAIDEIKKGTDFIFINFANADIVGHTANVPAIIKSIETVDMELGRVIAELEKHKGIALIIADHGNAEINIDETTGVKHTAHTLSLVPCILTGGTDSAFQKKGELRKRGELSDVAPTVLALLGIESSEFFTGKNLINLI